MLIERAIYLYHRPFQIEGQQSLKLAIYPSRFTRRKPSKPGVGLDGSSLWISAFGGMTAWVLGRIDNC